MYNNRKTAGTAENPSCLQTTLRNIQSNVKYCLEIYLRHSSLVPLTIWMTLTLTFQGHLRSYLMVALDFPYISYWWLRVTSGLTYLVPLWDIRLWNLSDLDLNLSRSLKVKWHSVIGLAICAFLLMVNSNIGYKSAPLRDIRLWNLAELGFDLSRSLKVKADIVMDSPIWFPIDG